jgi:hypothetical protein
MRTDVVLKSKSGITDGMTTVTGSRDAVYLDSSIKHDVRTLASLIHVLMPHFRTLLDLPEDITIRLAKTKKYINNGRWYDGENIATIDPRTSQRNRKTGDILDTLAHELVHAEQYHTGKLKGGKDDLSGKYGSFWMGSFVHSKGATYASYRKLPWEKEAFGRSGELYMEALVSAYKADSIAYNVLLDNVGWLWLKRNYKNIAEKVSELHEQAEMERLKKDGWDVNTEKESQRLRGNLRRIGS